MKNIKEKEEEH